MEKTRLKKESRFVRAAAKNRYAKDPIQKVMRVKKELNVGRAADKRCYAKDPTEHYRFQKAIIDQFVKSPWETCFGSLVSLQFSRQICKGYCGHCELFPGMP